MAGVLVAYARSNGMPEELFLLVWLTPWTFACLALGARWLQLLRARHWGQVLKFTLFVIPFFVAEVVVAVLVARAMAVALLLVLLALAGTNWLFYQLLKAPTAAGRRLLDEVDGFQRYLELAEKDELDFKHPAGKTRNCSSATCPMRWRWAWNRPGPRALPA